MFKDSLFFKNKWSKVLIAFETVLLILGVVMAVLHSEKVMPISPDILLSGNQFELPAGSYELRFSYDFDGTVTEQDEFVVITSYGAAFRSLLCNQFIMNPTASEAALDFRLHFSEDDLWVEKSLEHYSLNKISLVRTNKSDRVFIFWLLVIATIINYIVSVAIRAKSEMNATAGSGKMGISNERIADFAAYLTSLAICCLPICVNYACGDNVLNYMRGLGAIINGVTPETFTPVMIPMVVLGFIGLTPTDAWLWGLVIWNAVVIWVIRTVCRLIFADKQSIGNQLGGKKADGQIGVQSIDRQIVILGMALYCLSYWRLDELYRYANLSINVINTIASFVVMLLGCHFAKKLKKNGSGTEVISSEAIIWIAIGILVVIAAYRGSEILLFNHIVVRFYSYASI